MKTHVIFLHGFNVRDKGAGSIGKLMPYFAEYDCTTEMLAYGHFNLFAPRWKNKDVAKTLNRLVLRLKDKGYRVIVVAHSNGATITHKAGIEYQTPIDTVVYINPALDRDIRFPKSFGRFDVWHNPRDWVVRLSRWMPFNLWGDQGAYGFTRPDTRGKNYNMLTNFEASSGWAHSVFNDEVVEYFGRVIAERSLA